MMPNTLREAYVLALSLTWGTLKFTLGPHMLKLTRLIAIVSCLVCVIISPYMFGQALTFIIPLYLIVMMYRLTLKMRTWRIKRKSETLKGV